MAHAFLIAGCSDTEFAGSVPNAPHEESSSDAVPEPEPEPEPVGEETPPPPPELEHVEPPPFEESEETCISRAPGTNGRVDFETSPAGITPSPIGSSYVLTNQLLNSHGVAFSASTGFLPVVRRTSRRGESEMPSSEEAWLCILCRGWPQRNRLVDATAEAAVGRYVLSTTAAAQAGSSVLRIDYRIPVRNLSFDLIDVDGDEAWLIEPYDAQGNILSSLVQTITRSGYLKSRTGNGTPSRIVIETARDEIRGLQIRGAKPAQKFGFAFDNFDPGIPACD
jgi:hypothetical protein